MATTFLITILKKNPLLLARFVYTAHIVLSVWFSQPSLLLWLKLRNQRKEEGWMRFVQLCISVSAFLFHSFTYCSLSLGIWCLHVCAPVCVCVRPHGSQFCGFQTAVQWQHLKKAGDLGQWATYVSCIHLHWASLPSHFRLLFSWSIYHKLCKLSRWGDRRPEQALLWNRRASWDPHCCSGHVYWSTALQQATLPASPPLHHPAPCKESFLIHSPPNCFSPLLTLLESRGARRTALAGLGNVPHCWFGH